MNREYNCKVSSKNSKPLLKNLQNTVGDYFFLPHPVDLNTVKFPHVCRKLRRSETATTAGQ